MGESKLRVSILALNYEPEPTGIAPYVTGLAEGLAERGHEVSIVTALPHYPQWKVYPGFAPVVAERINGVSVTRLRHYVPGKPHGIRRLLSEVSFGFALRRTRIAPADVTVLLSPPLVSSSLALASLRRRAKGAPALVWVQDLYARGLAETGQGGGTGVRVIGGIERRLLRRATGVVVIHDRFAADVVAQFGVDPAAVSVVRNWTHVETPHSDRAATRKRLGWTDDRCVVLHAGNMGVKQGLQNVVEAARRADAEGLPLLFVLMGDGAARAELEAQARGVRSIQIVDGLPEHEFVGVLAAADILLVNELPGVFSMALPSKLTSYFVAGTPVLAAADAHGITAAELAASGAGVRVDPGDPVALADAALALAHDAERSQKLAAAGLDYVRSTLSRNTALDAFERVLRSAASPH